jgi:hypothetical protein
MRSAARNYDVPLSTVQHWCRRASGKRLSRVDWNDAPPAVRPSRRTPVTLERQILTLRKQLQERSALGEYGAPAIHRELQERGASEIPSVRTIGRILQRHGVLDARRRTRRPPPPAGWYLPQVAAKQAELDSFDTIEGLAIRGGPHLTILTGISLHGGLIRVWPQRCVSAKSTLEALVEHWREVGLPRYAQFDNDNRFTGPRQHADAIGRVIRLCLSLQVTPVFVPPKETGFQAAIESLNGRWQEKVWARFEHTSLRTLQARSARYVAASRTRHAARIEAAPARDAAPRRWKLNLQQPPRGTLIYLRRTNDRGEVEVLGHTFQVDRLWVHRLVRAEVDLDLHRVRFYALRRREPDHQPLLKEIPYQLPNRSFKE